MASFWQNKPPTAQHNHGKNALQNMISQGVSYTADKPKVREASGFINQNELEKAYVIYKNILTENPRNTDALIGIGVILEKQHKFDLAIEFLSRAIESDPSKAQALLTRGRIFRLQGMHEKAKSDFTGVISSYPNHFEALIVRGITFGQTSQFNAAIDDFSLAIRINSK